jgi:hypothetical protein
MALHTRTGKEGIAKLLRGDEHHRISDLDGLSISLLHFNHSLRLSIHKETLSLISFAEEREEEL